MRGLDTRVLLARARCMALHDAERADYLMVEVYYSAQYDGGSDAAHGINTPPLQFAGEADLIGWWGQGWDDYWLALEMRDCPACHRDDGAPCPFHD